jgi:3',5'-cyclic AMP phosphodiesterase CpdA
MAHQSERLLRRAISTANDLDPGLILVAGDLTGDGLPDSFAAVDRILAEAAAPTLVIPGNHDVPKRFDEHDSPSEPFTERYDRLPTVISAGPVSVIAANTASTRDDSLRDTWGGKVGDRDRLRLTRLCATVETPVLFLHHNIGSLSDAPGGKYRNFQLRDAAAIKDMLALCDVPLAISAHHHVPAVLTHGSTVKLLAPPVCSYPQAMMSIDIGPTGMTARLVPLATRDEIAAARRAAVTGKPLATGIAELVDRRVTSLPLFCSEDR